MLRADPRACVQARDVVDGSEQASRSSPAALPAVCTLAGLRSDVCRSHTEPRKAHPSRVTASPALKPGASIQTFPHSTRTGSASHTSERGAKPAVRHDVSPGPVSQYLPHCAHGALHASIGESLPDASPPVAARAYDTCPWAGHRSRATVAPHHACQGLITRAFPPRGEVRFGSSGRASCHRLHGTLHGAGALSPSLARSPRRSPGRDLGHPCLGVLLWSPGRSGSRTARDQGSYVGVSPTGTGSARVPRAPRVDGSGAPTATLR